MTHINNVAGGNALSNTTLHDEIDKHMEHIGNHVGQSTASEGI